MTDCLFYYIHPPTHPPTHPCLTGFQPTHPPTYSMILNR